MRYGYDGLRGGSVLRNFRSSNRGKRAIPGLLFVCINISISWIVVEQYRCKCRSGHWNTGGAGWLTDATLAADGGPLACTPCGMGSDATACLADTLRIGLLAGNLAGILICLVIAIIIFRKRKCKVCMVKNQASLV